MPGKASISSLSTLADLVGACTTVLQPLHALIEAHVLRAERLLHGDDTHVPILAKGKTIKGHIWTYVRDDRPFGGYGRRRHGAVLCLTRPAARTSCTASARLRRHPAGRCLQRLQ